MPPSVPEFPRNLCTNEYLHLHQIFQEDQVDHEHLEDPRGE